MLKTIRQHFRVFNWYFLRLIVAVIPLKMIFVLGDIGGRFKKILSRGMSEEMRRELIASFGDKHSLRNGERIIRRSFVLVTKNRMEELLFSHLTAEKTRRLISVEGINRLENALSRGKGVVLVIAHFGSNKLVMPALGFRGYKINQVAGMPTEWIRIMGEELTFVDRKLLQLEHKNDQHLPAKFIYVFRYMRAIYRCLDRNEIVCFAVDGGGGSKREGVDLLGRKIMLSKNPFKIANRANATILPAFVIRKPNNFHELVFEESIQVASDLKKNRDSECLKAFVRLLETYIQRYPCHYLYRMGLARSIRKRDPIPLFTDYEKVETV